MKFRRYFCAVMLLYVCIKRIKLSIIFIILFMDRSFKVPSGKRGHCTVVIVYICIPGISLQVTGLDWTYAIMLLSGGD